MTIGIIDYGMGNLRSVQKALQKVGGDAEILRKRDEIDTVDKLILPGVGSFADAMDNLHAGEWVEPIHRFAQSGRPTLGICLGMQLFFEASEEEAPPGELIEGLGLFEGVVRRLTVDREPHRLKVPHMGWNQLEWDRDDPLLSGVKPGDAVYFVHGYAVPAGVPDESARCLYGEPLCATAWRDNIWATQFHPEKSQKGGLKMLGDFVGLA